MRYLLLNPTRQYAASSRYTYILELTQMLKLQKVSKLGIRFLSWYLPSSLSKRKFPFEKKKHIHKCRSEIWKKMFCSEVTSTLGLKCLWKESIVTSALNSVLLTADILAGDVEEGPLSWVSETDNRRAENCDFPKTQQLLKFRQCLCSDVCRIL